MKGMTKNVIFLVILLLFSYFIFKETSFEENYTLPTQIPNEELRGAEGLFEGLSYRWNGTYKMLEVEQDWNGNLTVTHQYADIYTITEYDDYHDSTEQRDLNETTRLFNYSGHWDSFSHEWLFIHVDVEVGSVVPIVIDHWYDRDFDVVAIETIYMPYLGRSFTCWKLTDTWNSIAYYDRYTGILVNGSFRHSVGFYKIFPYETNAFQNNLFAPNLTDGMVTPASGNLSTYFTFSVNYSDLDGNYPKEVNVIIDGIVYPMEKIDRLDKNYTDGSIFEFSTFLDNASHTYFFNASDLLYSTRFPDPGVISGPTVDYINENPPILLGSVIPTMGTNWTRYRFELNYSDADNNPPVYTNLTLNGTTYQLTAVSETEQNYINGAFYYYETYLDGGTYEHYFSASDGVNEVRDPPSSNYSTPTVLTVYWPLADDVESGVDGWNVTGTPAATSTYGWHIVNTTSSSPTHSWWCGDDLTGEYGTLWNTSLESPLINLTVSFSANLTFENKYRLEDNADFGYVEIKLNGTSTWTELSKITGNQNSWTQTTINISSYIGNYVFIRFRFTSDISDSDDGWYLDNIAVSADQNLNPPVLDQGLVIPTVGNTSTIFNYTVQYTDADNNPPVLITVQIDGIYYLMGRQNPSDINYRDGCYYIYQTKLANTTHNYSFRATDGLYIVNEPLAGDYSGPTVNYINELPPNLTNGRVSQPSGDTSTAFIFEVNYTDPENVEPSSISVTINGTSNSMVKQDGGDIDYTDGCIYQYTTTLAEGVYNFHFNASDGDYFANDPVSGDHIGPWVARALSNNIPYTGTLSDTNTKDGFRFNVYDYDWCAVFMRPSTGNNFDLTFHDLYNYSDLVVGSYESGDEFELIGINGHDYTESNYHYARVSQVNGSGSYSIEAQFSVPDYTIPGGPYSGSISPNELIDAFELYMHTPYVPYLFTLDVPAGLDLSMYVMNITGGKGDAIAYINEGGSGEDESLVVTLTNSNEFMLVLVNENDGTGSYSFTVAVDTTPPSLTIESPLNQTYTTNTIPVNLSSSASDLDTLWYRVRNQTEWVTENTTWSEGAEVVLSDGYYTLFAWANDTQGYESEPENVSFTIEATPPNVTIISPLNQTYYEQTFLINLTSNAPDLDTIWYRIFNRSLGDWVDIANISYTGAIQRGLSDGLYTLYAWANDTLGNILTVPASVNFTINAPPLAIIDSPLNITYTTQTVQINLSCAASDLHMLWYQISNRTMWVVNKTIWSEGATEILADGIYTLFAWANDTFGLAQLTPTNVTFTIDSTPPTTQIISPTNNTYGTEIILVNLTCNASDVDYMWYRLFNLTSMTWFDPGNITWSTPSYRVLPDGLYIIYAWANDSAGNSQPSPTMIYFTIIAPPNFSITSPLNITYTSNTILIDINCTSPDLDTIWFRIFDGDTWITDNITWTEAIERTLDEGTYWIFIWANDTNGNEACIIISFSIQLESPGGTNTLLIIILVIVIGAVCAIAFFYKYKKSRKTKKGPKAKGTTTAQTLAAIVRPKDLDLDQASAEHIQPVEPESTQPATEQVQPKDSEPDQTSTEHVKPMDSADQPLRKTIKPTDLKPDQISAEQMKPEGAGSDQTLVKRVQPKESDTVQTPDEDDQPKDSDA